MTLLLRIWTCDSIMFIISICVTDIVVYVGCNQLETWTSESTISQTQIMARDHFCLIQAVIN